jgi:hypothetical protein
MSANRLDASVAEISAIIGLSDIDQTESTTGFSLDRRAAVWHGGELLLKRGRSRRLEMPLEAWRSSV